MEIDILLKILLSALLGGLIGLERELAQKEAGLRTNILIAVGSTLLTILSLKLAEQGGGDATRVAAHIVTGVGFLGAGAIIQARFAVHGLTTAASIWTVAAIGMGVGSGYYFISLMITVFVLVILVGFKSLSAVMERQKKHFAYLVQTEDRAAVIMEIKKTITELGIRYINLTVGKRKGGYHIEILLVTSEVKNKEFVEKVMQLKGVKELASEKL
jgi:putative Mg2+ transporter-C (MgtC) family protein